MIFLRSFIYLIVFYISMVFLFPKNELFSYIEQNYLNSMNLNLNVELQNTMQGYKGENSTVLYQNNKVVSNTLLTINPYLFYNSINVDDITLEGMVAGFFPQKIQNIHIKHTIFDPMNISFTAKGQFGNANGKLNLNTLVFSLELEPSNLMTQNYLFVLQNMKKNGKTYQYEYKL